MRRFSTIIFVLAAACSNGGAMLPDSFGDIPSDLAGELPDIHPDQQPIDSRPGDIGDTKLDLTDVGWDQQDIPADSPEIDVPLLDSDGGGSDTADGCGEECSPPEPLWAITLGGEMADVALSLAIDPMGAIYAGGHTNSKTFQVAGEVHAQIAPDDIRQVFITRLLPDGEPDWTRPLGGEGDDRLRGVAPRAAGGVLAAGFTGSKNLVIGEQQFVSSGKFEAWAAGLAEDGKVEWAISFGGEGDEILLTTAEDSDGNVYLGGYFSSASVQVGDLTLVNTLNKEQYDLMIIKLDSSGQPIWARVLGGTGFDYVHSMACDSDNNIYFLGALSGAGMKFGDELVATKGERDILVGSYTSNGDPRWIRSFGGNKHDAGHAMTVSADGDVYITGSLQSPVVDFGGGPIEHIGSIELHDIFLVRLTADGEHVWSHGYGGIDWDLSKCLALDENENLYMVGSFFSPLVKLGGEPLSGGGPAGNKSEVFVAAYGLDGSHRWSQAMGSPDHDVSYWVATGGPDMVAFVGTFNSTDDDQPTVGTMDPGTGPLPTYKGRDSFVVRLK
jgi:hypothetical protein